MTTINKQTETTRAGKDVEKLEPLGTASKNVKWCSYNKITWSFLKDLKIEALYSYIILR